MEKNHDPILTDVTESIKFNFNLNLCKMNVTWNEQTLQLPRKDKALLYRWSQLKNMRVLSTMFLNRTLRQV
jgi:hypothetical protein